MTGAFLGQLRDQQEGGGGRQVAMKEHSVAAPMIYLLLSSTVTSFPQKPKERFLG